MKPTIGRIVINRRRDHARARLDAIAEATDVMLHVGAEVNPRRIPRVSITM